MDQRRQLSAILFTDIEGYSAVLEQSEQKAMEIKDRHRHILQKDHEKFNGHLIQYYGDGTLSTFNSIVDAAKCALSMQVQYLQSPKINVRMGLHIGDIVYNDDSIFGEGVNLASRIESLGVAGCVLISDRANEELQNHPEIKTRSVGIYNFKNINRPVEVFALDHEGLLVPAANTLKGKTKEEKVQKGHPIKKTVLPKVSSKSIAVLPFVNMSNDPEQEYFSDGMAEEIINSLSQIKDLKVAGRTSTFRFKGKNIDLRTLGEQLGVSTVLEGSVRRQGNKLRVTAQLVKVEDGFHLWSEKFDRDMGDIFAIQDEISLAITKKLKISLLADDRNKIKKTYTQNTEAYELYLKGRFYINRRGPSILAGMQHLLEAIEIDPDFALAYAGYADALSLSASWGLVHPISVMKKVKEFAEKAIELAPTLSEPYCSLAFYYTFFERNWPEAKKNFLQSIELNPKYAQAHYWFGWDYLSWVEGDFKLAEKHGRIAIHLEPLSSICYATTSLILHAAGKYKEALEICKAGIELDANSFLNYLSEGLNYFSLHQYEKAISSYENALKVSNNHHFASTIIIWAYVQKGDIEKAKTLFEELLQRSKKEYATNTLIGLTYAYLDNLDEAFKYLQKGYDDPEPLLLSLKYESWVPAQLKSDPRYGILIKKINFPEKAEKNVKEKYRSEKI
jgi:TolB-like protein/class 3 adenylate cyclase/Tfp pilus assembly protein PilF